MINPAKTKIVKTESDAEIFPDVRRRLKVKNFFPGGGGYRCHPDDQISLECDNKLVQ